MEGRFIGKERSLCTETDWQTDKETREKQSENLEKMSVGVTRDSSQYRSVVEGFENFKTHANDELLKEIIRDVGFICHKIDITLPDIISQLENGFDMKNAMQEFISDSLPLLETAQEVMSLIDRQRDIDYVDDDVQRAVKTEVETLTTTRSVLTNSIDQFFPMLLELTKHKIYLMNDLQRKEKVLNIQKHISNLSPFSGDMSLKPWPEDSPLMIDERSWLQRCSETIKSAREAIEPAMKLISDSKNLITYFQNEIKKCRENTQQALRLKIQKLLLVRDSLVRQRRTLLKQADNVEIEKKNIEIARNQNHYRKKFVETKLEWLKFRPDTDLVQNYLHDGLLEEKEQLKQLKCELDVPMQDNSIVLNNTYDQIDDIEQDLMRKEHALMIEMSCLELHSNPPSSPYKTSISWLSNPTKNSKQILSQIQRHIDARELGQNNCTTDIEADEIQRRLQKLALTCSELNRLK